MKKTILLILTTVVLLSGDIISEKEKDLIRTLLPKTKINKIKRSYIDGFWTCLLDDGKIIYVNPFNRIIFFGEIYTINGNSITQQEKDELLANKQKEENSKRKQEILKNSNIVKDLLKDSKKVIYGKGSDKVGIIALVNPHCGYCQEVKKHLSKKDINVYYSFLDSKHLRASDDILKILSSKNLEKALDKKDNNISITQSAKDELKRMTKVQKKYSLDIPPTIIIFDLKTKKVIDYIEGAYLQKIDSAIKRGEK